MPDLGRPAVVAELDRVLAVTLARWGEDGDDHQGRTEALDGTESIGRGMGTRETEVVVELDLIGQTVPVPDGGREGTPFFERVLHWHRWRPHRVRLEV